jgi:hypothetical protein
MTGSNMQDNVLSIILSNLSERIQELLDKNTQLEKDIQELKVEITSLKRYYDYNI